MTTPRLLELLSWYDNAPPSSEEKAMAYDKICAEAPIVEMVREVLRLREEKLGPSKIQAGSANPVGYSGVKGGGL